MTVDCVRPIMMDGMALPIMTSIGENGVTSNWSKVPFSRSRATDRADSISVWIMLSEAISPGRRYQRVSRLGLYQARDSMVTCETGETGEWAPACSASL